MADNTVSYFKAHDNHRLYYEAWRPKKAQAILILVHGLNEHTGRYRHVVDYFKDDYAIYLYDHRGHGKSDGVRSHVMDFSHYIKDLNEFVTLVNTENPKKKIFIIGHSMGGQIVLNFLSKYRKAPLAGFITTSANVRVKLKINPIKKAVGFKLASFVPKIRLPNDVKTKWLSRDKAIVKAYEKDPLVGKNITARLAFELLTNQETLMAAAKKIQLPALMLHGGDDQICDPAGTVDFYEKLGSPDKELKIYDGMYHEIFNEFGKEEVLADVGSWLKGRV